MAYNLSVDGKQAECKVENSKLIFTGMTSTTVEVIDVIKLEEAENSSFTIHVINKSKSPKWSRSRMKVSGDNEVCNKFMGEIKDLMKQVLPKPRRFLVMINPVGGKQSGVKSYQDIVAPVFELAGITTEVIVSERPKYVIDVMTSYDFSETNGIVLCGGDGTYHECLATLLRRFQNEAGIDINDINAPIKPLPFPIAMIPTGTGNVIAGTNYGTDDIETAALHIVRGEMKKRCVCSFYEYGRFLTYAGQSFSYGIFTDMLREMHASRRLKGKMRLLIPLYYFLFKRHRQFQVEIEFTNKRKETESKPEEGIPNEDVEKTAKTETVKGSYTAAVSFIDDLTDDDFRTHASIKDSNCTLMVLYRPSGRLDLMSHFKRITTRNPDAFQYSFLHNVKFTGFKFKLLDDGQGQSFDPDGQKQYIAVDGEPVEIAGTEFECKWHKEIIPVYSSF